MDTISMDNRRQYEYITKEEAEQRFDPSKGMIGTWTGYPFQVVSPQPGDVLLFHIADSMSLRECNNLMKTLEEAFPDNKVLLSNEHVLKGMTILRQAERLDDKVSICSGVDVDALFRDIMKGNPNDFLY